MNTGVGSGVADRPPQMVGNPAKHKKTSLRRVKKSSVAQLGRIFWSFVGIGSDPDSFRLSLVGEAVLNCWMVVAVHQMQVGRLTKTPPRGSSSSSKEDTAFAQEALPLEYLPQVKHMFMQRLWACARDLYVLEGHSYTCGSEDLPNWLSTLSPCKVQAPDSAPIKIHSWMTISDPKKLMEPGCFGYVILQKIRVGPSLCAHVWIQLGIQLGICLRLRRL